MNTKSHTPEKTRTMHEVLRQIPYNIFVVGVGSQPDAANAFVCSWVSQCSFDPPLVSISVRVGTISYDLLQEEEVFCISFLNKNQIAVARRLVKPHHQVGDKMGQVSHFREVTGAPILRESIGFIECRIIEKVATGDHGLFIGEVVNAGQSSEEEPLRCGDIGWVYGG